MCLPINSVIRVTYLGLRSALPDHILLDACLLILDNMTIDTFGPELSLDSTLPLQLSQDLYNQILLLQIKL